MAPPARETSSALTANVVGALTFLCVAMFVPAWPEAFPLPKAIAMSSLAGVGLVVVLLRRHALRTVLVPAGLAGALVLWVVLSQVFSGAPQTVSWWGEWGRRSGTLTAISLALVFVGAALMSRREVRIVLVWVALSGIPAVAYATIQVLGHDPLTWNNQWVTSSFGNPNFAAAGLAILAVTTAALALDSSFTRIVRASWLVLAGAEAVLSVATGSSQGPFTLAAGVVVGALFVALRRPDRVGRIVAGVAVLAMALGAALVVLGLLGSGPATRLLSPDTLQFRQWYWSAAMDMALANPLFGVGPDGYGRFYAEFRPADSAANVGLASSAAHDVPLQWAATAGLPTALLYIALVVTVAVFALRLAWRSGAAAPILLVAAASGWVAYQVQSLVSIDEVSLAVMGWLLMGLTVGLSRPSAPLDQPINADSTSTGVTVSLMAVAAVVGALLWVPAVNAELSARDVQARASEQSVRQAIDMATGAPLTCRSRNQVARWAVDTIPAVETVDAVIAAAGVDDRCYGLVARAADVAIQTDQVDAATRWSERSVEIDPLNPTQWMLVARAASLRGDTAAAQSAIDRALELAPGDPAVLELAAELGIA